MRLRVRARPVAERGDPPGPHPPTRAAAAAGAGTGAGIGTGHAGDVGRASRDDAEPAPSGGQADPAGRPRRRWRGWFLRRSPATVVAASWLGLVVAATASTTLLSADFYGQALDRANAYDRVYTEVLPDPAVDDLLAGLPVDSSLVTANLRTVLPPSAVRGMTQQQIDGIVAYLRAETDDIAFAVDLSPVLENISGLANRYLAGEIGAGTTYQADSVRQFTAGVVAALEAIARGERVPSLPQMRLTAQEADIVVDTILDRVPEGERAALAPRLRAALRTGDLAGALTLVAGLVFTGDDRAVSQLSARLVDGTYLDLGVRLSDLRDQRAVRAMDRLHDVSQALPYICVVLALGVAAGLAAEVWRARRRGVPPVRAAGVAVLTAGCVALLVGFVLRAALPNPLAPLAEATSPLPPGASGVLVDFGTHAYGDVQGDYLRFVLVTLLVGGVVTVLSLLWTAADRLGQVSRARRLAIVVPVVTAMLVAATWASFPSAIASTREVCNGHAELCDRHYDEVVYPATHNAMASSEDRFLSPNQDPSVVHQLDLGVRALLIDAVRWTAPEQVEQFLASLSPEVRAALEPLARGAASTRPGTWLCHNLCQLGAIDAVDQLREVGDWMRRNPTEVVTIVVQDGVNAAELAGTVSAAGLGDLVATPPDDPGGPWPTLGEMVDDGRRLYVFTESQDLPGTFLRNFYRYASDTPFANTKPADLENCAVERGSEDAPLLLVNHWLTDVAPSRRAALASNASRVVVERARLCESERGRLPTFVAVDFVSTGSLVSAVDTLNRITP